jgi:hypothetical protein
METAGNTVSETVPRYALTDKDDERQLDGPEDAR